MNVHDLPTGHPGVARSRRWPRAAGWRATIVNIAVPDITRWFPGASASALSWVLNAYPGNRKETQ